MCAFFEVLDTELYSYIVVMLYGNLSETKKTWLIGTTLVKNFLDVPMAVVSLGRHFNFTVVQQNGKVQVF